MEAYTLDWQKGQLIQDRMQEANYKRISDKKIARKGCRYRRNAYLCK